MPPNFATVSATAFDTLLVVDVKAAAAPAAGVLDGFGGAEDRAG